VDELVFGKAGTVIYNLCGLISTTLYLLTHILV